jgi:ribose-phosphate pyrophosphokinase
MRLVGDVKGKDVILLDDIVDTGGTLCKAAEIIMENGASSVRAMVTHPLLSGNAIENIENSALNELIVTDTIPLNQESEKIRVLSTADLFAEVIRRLKRKESISSLFKF